MSSNVFNELKELNADHPTSKPPFPSVEKEIRRVLLYCNTAFSYLYTLDTQTKEVFTYNIWENSAAEDWMVTISYSEESADGVNTITFPVSSVIKKKESAEVAVDSHTIQQTIVEFSILCIGQKTVYASIAPKFTKIFNGIWGVSATALANYFSIESSKKSLKTYLKNEEEATRFEMNVRMQKCVPFFGKKIREHDWLSAYRQYGLEHLYIRFREKKGNRFGKWQEYYLLSDEGIAEYYDKYINEENEDKFDVAIVYKGKNVPISLRIKVLFKDIWRGIKNFPRTLSGFVKGIFKKKQKERTKEELCISLVQDYYKSKGMPTPPIGEILVQLDQIEKTYKHEKQKQKNARKRDYRVGDGTPARVRDNRKHRETNVQHGVDGECCDGCNCKGHQGEAGDNPIVPETGRTSANSLEEGAVDSFGDRGEFASGNSCGQA